MNNTVETVLIGGMTLLGLAAVWFFSYLTYIIYKEDGLTPIMGALSLPFVAYLIGLLVQNI